MQEERVMTRQEVWAVYERGARRHSREFIVMCIDTGIPEPIDVSAGTERMEMARTQR
jgi:hypothetical protein